MKNTLLVVISVFLLAAGAAALIAQNGESKQERIRPKPGKDGKVKLTDAEWKKYLNDEEFRVLRGKGTETCFTGIYHDTKQKGTYLCNACDLPLFSSEHKFNSGTGWPSYFQPVNKKHIKEKHDGSLGMSRIEVLCSRCDSHLGHVFDDGPKPTGRRYCINSIALFFVEKK